MSKSSDGKWSSKNYIGTVIGDLTILDELEPHITPNGSKQRIVRCRCKCGNEFTVRLESAKKSQKCRECLNKNQRVDITGKRFGKLVVKAMAPDYISPSGHRLSQCECVCDCGKIVIVAMTSLVTGSTKSCGCLHNTAGLLKDCPELMEKYDYEKNKDIELNSLTARASRKIWWKCNNCGESWFATVASQNDKIKHGCPYCAGTLVVKGKTDLLSKYPEIVKTWWDYEKNLVKPDEITSKSNMKVWWKCKEGHSWKATVANKVGGTGCPRCNLENVNSFCEQAVFFYVKKAFPDAVNGDRHIGMELDIFIPSLKTAIEYDGEAWHESARKIDIDVRKNDLCHNSGVNLIRIREPRLKPVDNCIVFVRKDSTSNESLDDVIRETLNYLGKNSIEVNTQKDMPEILAQYASKKNLNSLANVCPEIAAEWHPTKNGALTPDKVNKASRYKVWWLGKCGHEWQMVVSSRTIKPEIRNGKKIRPHGCPYCSGKKILVGFNDMKSRYPEIAAEWHPVKNGELKPEDIAPGSHGKVWWLGKCGHEWEDTPNHRCQSKRGCPLCFKQKRSPAVMCVETNRIFSTGFEAASFMGNTTAGSIYRCCRSEQKKAGGYHWTYVNEIHG